MLEPYVIDHLWDEDDILVIWNDVRASIAQEASQGPPIQGGEGPKARPKRKIGKAWAKTAWKKFRGVLKKVGKKVK